MVRVTFFWILGIVLLLIHLSPGETSRLTPATLRFYPPHARVVFLHPGCTSSGQNFNRVSLEEQYAPQLLSEGDYRRKQISSGLWGSFIGIVGGAFITGLIDRIQGVGDETHVQNMTRGIAIGAATGSFLGVWSVARQNQHPNNLYLGIAGSALGGFAGYYLRNYTAYLSIFFIPPVSTALGFNTFSQ